MADLAVLNILLDLGLHALPDIFPPRKLQRPCCARVPFCGLVIYRSKDSISHGFVIVVK